MLTIVSDAIPFAITYRLDGDESFFLVQFDIAADNISFGTGGRVSGAKARDDLLKKYMALMQGARPEDQIQVDEIEGYWMITACGQRMFKKRYALEDIPTE